MKVDLPEEVEQHKITAWIRAHRSASRIIAAIVLTLIVVGACAIARAAPLTIDCAGAWSMSGSTATCTPAGQPVPPTPVPPPVPPQPPAPPGCSVVDGRGEVSVSFPGSVAVKFVAPASGAGTKKVETSPHGGGGSFDVAISATPCDYANPVRFATSTGKLGIGNAAVFGSNGFVTLYYKAGVNVDAGGTYYVNARASSGGLIVKMP